MARNIEIEARIHNIDTLASKAAALADEGPIEIAQDDTFFRCGGGRLELRAFSETGESAQSGIQTARELMAQLGVEPAQLVERAYLDLLAEKRA